MGSVLVGREKLQNVFDDIIFFLDLKEMKGLTDGYDHVFLLSPLRKYTCKWGHTKREINEHRLLCLSRLS